MNDEFENPNLIDQNAAGPRRVQTESGSVEQHSLPDQIAADVHQRRIAASRHPFRCLRKSIASFGPFAGTVHPIPYNDADRIWRP